MRATELTSELQTFTIAQLVGRGATETPENIAIVAPGRSPLTYSRLVAQIEESVRTLNEMGLGRNDRIAIVLPNGPEMAVAFLAAGSAGTCAPLNPAYRASEFDFYLNDLNAKALIVQSGVESAARAVACQRGIPIIELTPCAAADAGLFTLEGDLALAANRSGFAVPDDVALVLHTSGTTARPKIVPLTHQNLCASARHIRETLELAPGDRCLNVMPLFHIHGLIGAALSSLASGASLVCTPGFYAPKFFEWMDEFRPNWYTAVPTMHQAILARADTNREIIERCPLRLIRSSSAALPPQVMTELERTFKAPVIESYGMTEASHQMASNPLPPRVRKPGSVGLAAGPEIAIMGDAGDLLPAKISGEIVIRGPNVIAGYENNAAANASAFTSGWFRTGDQGYLDPNGYLFIDGRLKEIINRGGEKISPREIDEVLLSHPAVAQAAAFAIPHRKLGEEIAAAVVLREKSSATERDLREFAAARLADFKVPCRILILDEIPKGPTGKMQRIGLAEKLGLQTINPELPAQRRAFTGPRDDCESALANIWSEILGQAQLSVYDNFLELGGDSILGAQILARVRRKLGVELTLLVLFEEGSNIAGLAEAIRRANRQGETSPAIRISPRKLGSESALSFGQEQLWFLDQFDSDRWVHNRSLARRFFGPLQEEILTRSLTEITRRHEVLRTAIRTVKGRAAPVILAAQPVKLNVIDLENVIDAERESEARRLAVAEARRPFDLAEAPLMRTTLMRLSPHNHILMVAIHHIISDGWSDNVLWHEFSALYHAFAQGQPSPLPELPIQYADFARWQRDRMRGEALERNLNYWKKKLDDAPRCLELPRDRPRPKVRTSKGSCAELSLSAGLTEALKSFSQQEGVTLFMTLLAAFQTLIFRYTGQEDVVVGSPVSGRGAPQLNDLIGPFITTLVLRTDLSGNPAFRDLLGRVRQVALEAYAHQDTPFERLLQELQPKRDVSRTSLFQVLFNMRNFPQVVSEIPGLRVERFRFDQGSAQFDFDLELEENDGSLSCLAKYSTDLFDDETVQRLLRNFARLLQSIVANPAQPIRQLDLLTIAERDKLVGKGRGTEALQTLPPACQHTLFEEQAERTPEAIAVVFESEQISYRSLNARSNQLAHHLRQVGVRVESRVAICMERSVEMIVALFGVWKAGACFVPLDPSGSKDRLAFIIADAGISVVLTQEKLKPLLPNLGPALSLAGGPEMMRSLPPFSICLVACPGASQDESDLNLTTNITPQNLAYIIYTSGSTGQPKGVMISHEALVNYTRSAIAAYEIQPTDRVLQFASICFDASAEEIYPCLSRGATLVLRNEAMVDSAELFLRKCEQWDLTVISLPTAYWHQLAAELEKANLRIPASWRLVIIGGELAFPERLTSWLKTVSPSVRLVNTYGPTEATVVATLWTAGTVEESTRGIATVPIGQPLPHVQAYVLDPNLQPVPIGVAGELCLAGEGLARGYLNQPALTAEKFIPNPFSHIPGARLYQTGDRARYLPHLCLEFLGRLDRQIKIRGFRIELGEIESVLAGHPGVREVAVLAREDMPGEKRLVAYVVPSSTPKLLIPDLLRFLKQKLPDYMVPSVFFALEKLPLNSSGKIDHGALPKPGPARPDLNECYTAARTAMEVKLVGIWEQVLRLDRVGVYDDFFELGGHSLLAIQIISRVCEAFQVELPLRTLFDAPTVAALALRISQNLEAKTLPQGKSHDK